MPVQKQTKDLITSKGPEHYKHLHMTVGLPDAVKVTSMTDETISIVQITLYGEIISTGIARRHPGDARNQELGLSLALVRAFTEGATKYAYMVERLMNPAPDPSSASVKEMRKLIKADARRRHAIKRKAAREAHREIMGWDHTTFASDSLGDAQ